MTRAFKCIDCETIVIFTKEVLARLGYQCLSADTARRECPFCKYKNLQEILDTEITVTV